jgi:sulfur-oxidizing protein SoxZ
MPDTAKKGEIVDIKAILRHPMETGYRVDRVGQKIPRNIVTELTVTYNGTEVLRWHLQPGIAANPYIGFSTVATETGELVFTWRDDRGQVISESRSLTVE